MPQLPVLITGTTYLGTKKRVQTKLKTGVLKRLTQKCWFSWNCHQRKIAKHALRTVARGAETALKKVLPGIVAKNAKSAFVHGVLLTDTIAQWVKNKMVAGPFDEPPLNIFE